MGTAVRMRRLSSRARGVRPGRRPRRHPSRLRAARRAGRARCGGRARPRAGEHLVAEAGTGTGKSLAYLLPALESGRRVVVATATKALQEQLLAKDVPAAARALGRDVHVAVLKGRQNYLCRRQLQGFGPMLLRVASRRGGLGGPAAVARRHGDRRPGRAPVRAVRVALGRARGRRRPLRGPALPAALRRASPRPPATGRARPSS